jgi:hypothetical protein
LKQSNAHPDRSPHRTGLVNLNAVVPGFFSTLGIRALAGRDPLGIHIGVGSGPDVKPDIVIVGVCAGFNYRDFLDDFEKASVPNV